jgi:Holliday junction resolvasome RuvABC endonuclease subunit
VIAVGIDCATTTGWAIVERKGGRETLRGHGILKLNTPHVWNPIAWLALQARPWGGPWPDVVAIELPWLGKNPHTLEVLARYCGRFEQAFTSTPTRLVKASEWQSKILGRFGGKKRAGLKRAAVLWVKGTFGVDVSDDEADAIGLAVYALRFP